MRLKECVVLIWSGWHCWIAWPSVSTGANKAFDAACEHAVNSKAISGLYMRKETTLRFRSHHLWLGKSKVKLNWQRQWQKKQMNLIKLRWPFSPWVYSSGRTLDKKSDNDRSDDFLSYLIRRILDIPFPRLIKCEYRLLNVFWFNTLTWESWQYASASVSFG